MLSEEEIIHKLKQQFPVPGGIGDDAAVLPFSDEKSYVITKDLLIEDTHFRRKYVDATSLAHKALHVNLSDIAGMGAKATYVLLGISIPNNAEHYINEFLQSFSENCKASGVVLMGGDTTKSPDKLFISVTAIGIAEKANLKFRNGARVGDIICVIGPLGNAHLGWQALENNLQGLLHFKQGFLKPNAKILEGQWLSSKSEVTAMMDISDGLFIDLKRLCTASNVAGEINLDALNCTLEFNDACEYMKMDPIQTQLLGGEDYGLLLCVKSASADLLQEFLSFFGYPLLSIGVILNDKKGKIIFRKEDKPALLHLRPFSHFGEL